MSLKPDIHLTYTSKIWNLYAAGKAYLLLELRDELTLSVSYDLFDFKTKKYIWRDLGVKENWRVGVSHCNENLIVFHKYKTGTVPAVEALIAVDIYSSEEIWTIKDVQPLEFGREYLKGMSEGEEIYLSLETGEIAKEDIFFVTANVINTLKLPLTYTEGSDNFATVKKFIEEKAGEEAVGPAEYLEYFNNIFLAYHCKKDDHFIVRLLGIDKTGNIWLKYQVEESKNFVSDIFFVLHHYLIFLEGKHTLKAVNLDK